MELSERVRNAIRNEGPRTNNADALADEVAQLEAENETLKRIIEEMEETAWCGHASLYCGAPKQIKKLKAENVRLRDATEKWLDCAVYDEGSHTWTVFEKNDEYHKLYTVLKDVDDETK